MEHRTVRTPAHAFSQFRDNGHYIVKPPDANRMLDTAHDHLRKSVREFAAGIHASRRFGPVEVPSPPCLHDYILVPSYSVVRSTITDRYDILQMLRRSEMAALLTCILASLLRRPRGLSGERLMAGTTFLPQGVSNCCPRGGRTWRWKTP